MNKHKGWTQEDYILFPKGHTTGVPSHLRMRNIAESKKQSTIAEKPSLHFRKNSTEEPIQGANICTQWENSNRDATKLINMQKKQGKR